jgi:O-antigen/teichoic acid export membrane protein
MRRRDATGSEPAAERAAKLARSRAAPPPDARMLNAPGEAAAAKGEGRRSDLARLAMRGGVFTLAGRGASELLRFGSNLLMTRLLAPEAFGSMLVVHALVQGARMLSDLGIRGSIVSHPRGAERLFLDTAWTAQALRGAGIFVALLVGADWLARLESHPEAATLIRVVAVCTLIEGLTSTSTFFLVRQVRPGRAVARDLAARAIGIAVAICWALAAPSVWALVAGAIATSVAQAALSHRMIAGYRDRFRWDKDAAEAIKRFGRWVFVATAMTYLLHRSDTLVLATMMSKTELGVYAIAIGLPQAVIEVVQMIAGNVLFPVYARLRHLDLGAQRQAVQGYRIALLAVALPVLWVLAIAGPEVIRALYDSRYAEAGWMLQLFAIATIPAIVSVSAERVLMASGDSRSHFLLQASQAALLLGGIWIGSVVWGGPRGVLLGLIAGRAAGYGPLAVLLGARGFWLPKLDLLAFAASGLALLAGFAWRGSP